MVLLLYCCIAELLNGRIVYHLQPKHINTTINPNTITNLNTQIHKHTKKNAFPIAHQRCQIPSYQCHLELPAPKRPVECGGMFLH